jgi:hypothetical protein
VRARPLDIAVGQEASQTLGVVLLLTLFVEIAVVQQGSEHVLRYPVMVGRVRVGERVIGDADVALRLQEPLVKALEDLGGVIPSCSARTETGVPCESDPETISTSLPTRR